MMKSLNSSLAVLIASSCLALSVGRAETVTVNSTGIGRTRAEAVTNGLVEAVQRATGVRIDQMAITGLNQRVTQVDANANASNGGSRSSVDFSGTVKTSQGMDVVASQSGGAIKTYAIVSSSTDSRGYLTIELRVDVEKFQSVMPETAKRIRIAVATFEGLDPQQAVRLQDRLNVYFAQARRFSVVDRTENAQYRSEMALVTSAAANMAERVRFGQVLGADFILTGKFNLSTRREEVLDPLTMARMTRERVTGDVIFSLIEIATRQVQWSNSVKLDGGNTDVGFEKLSRVIGSQVSETLFPLRVVASEDPQALTINQGGQSVKASERYRLVALGQELTDPDTKESLGRREIDLGVVEITRVDNVVSYARLVSGRLDGASSLILRRLDQAMDGPKPAQSNPGTRSKAFD